MNSTFELIVVLPVSQDSSLATVIDAITAFKNSCTTSHKIILSDDSQKDISNEVINYFPDIDVLQTRNHTVNMCGPYISLSNAFSYALKKYNFNLLLKVEADAIVIEYILEKKISQIVDANSNWGIAGLHNLNYDNEPFSLKFLKTGLVKDISGLKFLRLPFTKYFLKRIYNKALKNNYKPGENIYKGAYFISKGFLEKLNAEKLLPNYYFSTVTVREDYLFAMLAKSAGFEIINLETYTLHFNSINKEFFHYDQLKNSVETKVLSEHL